MNKNRKFPILINGSIALKDYRVHPPAKIGKSINGELKTENWYIAYATDEAAIFAGLVRTTLRI